MCKGGEEGDDDRDRIKTLLKLINHTMIFLCKSTKRETQLKLKVSTTALVMLGKCIQRQPTNRVIIISYVVTAFVAGREQLRSNRTGSTSFLLHRMEEEVY